jgi:hypothetical protein
MTDKLSVLVRVDLGCAHARIAAQGHVTAQSVQALCVVAKRANTLMEGLQLEMDVTACLLAVPSPARANRSAPGRLQAQHPGARGCLHHHGEGGCGRLTRPTPHPPASPAGDEPHSVPVLDDRACLGPAVSSISAMRRDPTSNPHHGVCRGSPGGSEPDDGFFFVREVFGGTCGRRQSQKGMGDDAVDRGIAQDGERRDGGGFTIMADCCPTDGADAADL